MADGTEPIDDDELLYRRVPLQYFDESNDPKLSPKTFRPRSDDITGLSVSRAKYKSVEQVAQNSRDKRYYVAVLRAGDLRTHGILVEPKPKPPDDLGHAELPGLTYDHRKDDSVEEWQVLLAEKLCLRVEGPFPA
ncbi:MAG: hypothetical protein QGH60_24120 [Phycisphaerae bacterium]|jgi:hypothetical protein|nr:hypothetical protein [Phycisphaerae bacterium]